MFIYDLKYWKIKENNPRKKPYLLCLFLRFSPVHHIPSPFSSFNFPCFCSTIHAILPTHFWTGVGQCKRLRSVHSTFLSGALCILLFSSTVHHFLTIFCAPVWSTHGLLYTSGLPCLGKGPFMGPSASGLVSTPVPPQAAFSVGLFLPCCGIVPGPSPPGPSVIQHGFPWIVPPLPNINSFQECISSMSPSMSPSYSSSISFLQAGLFTFLLTCPVFVSSCVFSHVSYCFPLSVVSCASCASVYHPFSYMSEPVHCVLL